MQVACVVCAARISPGEEGRVDKIGALASSLCAIHCALCALLPAAFGAIGLGFLMGHEAEWAFTLFAIAFAGGALALGWRRHRSRAVVAVLLLGIVGLLASRAIEMGSGHHDHHGHGERHHQEHEDARASEQGHHEDEHHHDHQDDDAHHASHAQHGEHGEHGEHGDAHAASEHGAHEDEGGAHLFGAIVGVLAGLMLLIGHVMNLRATRQCQGGCS